MDGLLLLLAPVIALLLWGAISPRSQWQRLFAWSYRNPEANEPSDAAYALTRVVNIVILGVLVWQVIGLTTTGDDVDAQPAVTTRPPAATFTATAVGGEELRAAFGVDEATVVVPSVVTAQPRSTRPVKVLRRQAVEAASPPGYMGQTLTGQNGSWLVLGIRADEPPTSVQINEVAFRGVAVNVLAGCTAPCPTAAVDSGETFYLVPVRLARPLADRPVLDHTNQPIP